MIRNLLSLVFFLAILGAIGTVPLLLWLGAAVAGTRRRT